ncbi:DUF459 domain-containing protein [Desulfolutivibrio sulfoxidireducens]|nr:DUF459 domain-containing protein [Desulfolutivibrio sulfoxidireducens]
MTTAASAKISTIRPATRSSRNITYCIIEFFYHASFRPKPCTPALETHSARIPGPWRVHLEYMDTPCRPAIPTSAVILLLALVLCLVTVPGDLLSMRPPDPEFPFPASLAPGATHVGQRGESAVRLPVVAHAVRLPADKKAQHPRDHPLHVRRAALAPGIPDGRRIRVFAVNEPPLPWFAAMPPTQTRAEPPTPVGPRPEQAPSLAARPEQAPSLAACPEQAMARASQSGPPPASTATARAPGAPPASTVARTSLLVVGDSLSISLADVLERRLAGTPGLAFARLGKISSGLARPDFFDWEAQMDRMAGQNRPDTVVIMIGANDNKPVRLASGKSAAFGSPAWAAEYRRRAARLVEVARAHNPAARIVWVGAPVMGDPALARDLPAVNAALAQEMRRIPGCRFVDVWGVLAGPEGRYLEFAATPAKTRLRTPDGVHLAPAGASRLAEVCLAALSEPAPNVLVSQLP